MQMILIRKKKAIIIFSVVFLLWIFFILKIHSFLALTKPVPAQLLVVEGWLYDRPALSDVFEEYNTGNYELLVVVGKPYKGASIQFTGLTTADIVSQELIKKGIDQQYIVVLPVPSIKRHRTLTKGLAVEKWIVESGKKITAINVFTIGVHARKSQLLFQKALGPSIDVGIIAGKEVLYERSYWWLSPDGIRIVSRNVFGYIYALLIFTLYHG